MATITLRGNPLHTSGNLPTKGSTAPAFKLVKNDMSDATLETYAGKRKVLNVFPSIDTPTCAMSVRKFNQEAAALPNTAILNISVDLPFAQKRFCGAEGITNAESLSAFRSTFPKDYGLMIAEGPMTGLCSRAVVVLDENNKVIYSEQVPEIAQEPNYTGALQALKG